MNRVIKIVKTNNSKMHFWVLVMFAFFTSSVAFAQKSDVEISLNEVSINQNDYTIDTPPVKVSTSELNSNMNFILWFMGTKEDLNSNNKSKESFYSKKSIITSGREPNHLLLKTLLKKAINSKAC
ncbi:hypothetical protein [Flavobacterium granuli]|uniref:Uncharacterized protein n=1 Tax=Flavobacterium granuli TaxID=280093 RepID=A0ABU1RYL1_9FLAO|nr:hypothetical protein [Flavobacterium granuli]MDR6843846.1 hypothetical protein [Flavobacterium granuli]